MIKLKKFKIPVTPKSTNKTIRFPNEIIKRIEKALVGTDSSFSAFVIEASKIALENLEEQNQNKDDNKDNNE